MRQTTKAHHVWLRADFRAISAPQVSGGSAKLINLESAVGVNTEATELLEEFHRVRNGRLRGLSDPFSAFAFGKMFITSRADPPDRARLASSMLSIEREMGLPNPSTGGNRRMFL
jgi:hypothetical protein